MGVDLGVYRARIGAFSASVSASLYSVMGASQLFIWTIMAGLLLKLSGDVEENPGPPKPLKKPETIEDWDPGRLKQWLQKNGLDKKYCDRMYQEEVDGLAFLCYTKEHLSEDFQMKKGPLQMVLHRQREVQPKETDVWAVAPAGQNWQQWLQNMHIPEKYRELFASEEVDGNSISLMTKEDLSKDFGLKKGPMRKILYSTFGTQSDISPSVCSNQPLETFTTDMITEWLRSKDFPEKYISVMNEEEVNGAVLQCYSEKNLQNDFNMKKGPAKWLIYMRNHWVTSSDISSLNRNDQSEDLKPILQSNGQPGATVEPHIIYDHWQETNGTANSVHKNGGDLAAIDHSDHITTVSPDAEQSREPALVDTQVQDELHNVKKIANGSNQLARTLHRGSFGKVAFASSSKKKVNDAAEKKDSVPPTELTSLRHNPMSSMLIPTKQEFELFLHSLTEVPQLVSLTHPDYVDPAVPFLPHVDTTSVPPSSVHHPFYEYFLHQKEQSVDKTPEERTCQVTQTAGSTANKQEKEKAKKVKSKADEARSCDVHDMVSLQKSSMEKNQKEAKEKSFHNSSLVEKACAPGKEIDQKSTTHEVINIPKKLQNILALPFEEYHPTGNSTGNYTKAKIQLIYSRWGTKENSLEKVMCFCILLQDTLNSSSKRTLWKNICKNLTSWHRLMDATVKKKFCGHPTESGVLVLVDHSQPISLRNSEPVMRPLDAKDLPSIAKRANVFFLVHQSFLTEKETSYSIHINQKGNSSRVLLTFSKYCRWHAYFDDKGALTFKSDTAINSNPQKTSGEDNQLPRNGEMRSEGAETVGKIEMSKAVNNDSTDVIQPISPQIIMTDAQSQEDDQTVSSTPTHKSESTLGIENRVTGHRSEDLKQLPHDHHGLGIGLGGTMVKSDRGAEGDGKYKERVKKDTKSSTTGDHSMEEEQFFMEDKKSNVIIPPTTSTCDQHLQTHRHNSQPPNTDNKTKSTEWQQISRDKEEDKVDDDESVIVRVKGQFDEQLLQPESHYSHGHDQSSTHTVQQEEPRHFDKAVGPYYYRQYRELGVIETGRENLIDPVHEFKEFTEAVYQSPFKQMQKFIRETLRFACGMLNTRNNGTIHFGITDKALILGVAVSNKAEFEEQLGHYKQKCFQGQASKAAADCIRPPKFVPVKDTLESLYVIEIDVVPSIAQCKGQSFLVKLPSYQIDEKRPGKIVLESTAVLYIRNESKTVSLKDHMLVEFVQSQLPKLDAERESAEKQALPITGQISTTNLAEKFIRLLCCNQKTLDSSFFPILVINAPAKKQKSLDNLRESFRFVQDIDWVAVFDFDPNSLQDGLCRLYREKKANQLWDPSTFEGKSDISELINEIQFPEVTSWIFCNGRTDKGEDPFDRRKWNRERSPGVKDAVRFFCRGNVVPAGRAIVVFFLLSNEVEPMVEVFFEFHSYLHGVDCLMCVAESHDTFHPWIKEITQNHKCDRKEVLDRSVVGMPWPDVQEEVLRMKGLSQESQCFIPTSTGSRCVLKDRDRNMLRDLEILSQNECESTQIEKDKEAFEVFRKEKEIKFYKGHKVEWWNFWFTDKHYNQVLRRDKFEELKEKVYDKLKHKDFEHRMETVTLYHQPGAGGSTLARHVLWNYRKSYRCCVVKKITQDTCNQILKLHEYEEHNPDACFPVLVLIEDVDEMEFRDLCAFIESKAGRVRRGIKSAPLVCVVLHCKVRETPSASTGYRSKQAMDADCVLLDQELSEAECNWFTMKLKRLENDPAGLEMYTPRHMISFMILKENFNLDYVKKTVTGILEGIEKSSPEKNLLKYIALLNSYVADSPVAVACCDLLMGVSYFNVRRNHDWEFLLSSSAKLLLLEMQKFSIGSVKAFKIVHPLVSKEVLNQLAAGDAQPLSVIVIEFLRSKLFQTPSFAKGDLIRMTTEMLKRRKKLEYGDDCDTAFSPLVQEIIEDEGYYPAAKVLIEGSTLFAEDPILAQQVARVYIKAKDFDKALTFAKKAVDKNPTNSFILDTLGQVYKEQLQNKFMHYVTRDKRLSPADAKEAISLAFGAIQSFRQSQDANEKDYNADNEAGYYGELSVCFKLLDLLSQVDEFKGSFGKKKLHLYLTSNFKPQSIALPWAEYHRDLKSLKPAVGKSLEWITDYVTTFKSPPYNNYDNIRHKKMKWHYFEHHNSYRSYFGEEDSNPPPELTDAEDLNEWRRRRVIALGGDHFRNIFQLVVKQTTEAKDDLLEIKRLLQQNEPRNHFDLKNLITVNLALSCLDPNIRGIASCQELFEMAKCLVQASQGAQTRGDPYPYYFLSMFLWPRNDMKIDYHNLMFQDALDQLKACYQAREKHRESSQHGMKKMAWRKSHYRKPMTFFFLSKGKGLQAFTHISKLVSNPASLEKQGPRDGFWDSPTVKGDLLQLKGVLKDRNTLLAENIMMGHKPSIEVQLSIPIEFPGVSQEPVTFNLGFSWEGPVAYNVKEYDLQEQSDIYHPVWHRSPVEHEELSESLVWEEERNKLDILKKKREKLAKKLQSIRDLKARLGRRETLEKNQVDKIKEEANVRQELQEVDKAIKGHWMEQVDEFD